MPRRRGVAPCPATHHTLDPIKKAPKRSAAQTRRGCTPPPRPGSASTAHTRSCRHQDKKQNGPPPPSPPRRASNLRPPGRDPHALPVCYSIKVVRNPYEDHQLQVPAPPSMPSRYAPTQHQEQQLFMRRPAPSPPRFAAAREDGAHCGAGPPCTFRYALPPSQTLICPGGSTKIIPPRWNSSIY